jgi:hypothetical protein
MEGVLQVLPITTTARIDGTRVRLRERLAFEEHVFNDEFWLGLSWKRVAMMCCLDRTVEALLMVRDWYLVQSEPPGYRLQAAW